MARSRASAKKAGTALETQIAKYLAARVDERIHRKTRTGAKDEGDIGGLRTPFGELLAVECKDYGGKVQVKPWLDEAEVEAGNYDAVAGIVVAKRRGTALPGEQLVMMTVDTLVRILTGEEE